MFWLFLLLRKESSGYAAYVKAFRKGRLVRESARNVRKGKKRTRKAEKGPRDHTVLVRYDAFHAMDAVRPAPRSTGVGDERMCQRTSSDERRKVNSRFIPGRKASLELLRTRF